MGQSALPERSQRTHDLPKGQTMRGGKDVFCLCSGLSGGQLGLGGGAFVIAPWVMINNAYSIRPFRLTVTGGSYAIAGCGLIGSVLSAL
jgi:hypothetical protein